MSSKWFSSSKPSDKEKLKKGPWTFEEDILLLRYIKLHGPGRWNNVAKVSGLQRCGKSCRLRWVNNLRPDLKRESITPEEERQISDLHARLGNRWSLIAEKIPGRTDNEIKNFCRSRMRKRRVVPSSPCSDGGNMVMSSPESNIPSLTSMANQTELLNVPNNMDHYQVEEFVKWEPDEVLSYRLPWPEQDALTPFLSQLYLWTHDMPASNPCTDITSLPTHPFPQYDHSGSFHDLGVTDTLWNTFPLLHEQSQMPPLPEILNSHIQR